MVGLLLLTAANLFQVIGAYAADWNETHIYNRNWPPHAKFHNAQTMAMAVVLAVASLYFVWRKREATLPPMCLPQPFSAQCIG